MLDDAIGVTNPNVFVFGKPGRGKSATIKAEPLMLINGKEKLTLRFDCKPCEMHVVGKMKKSVLNQHAKETEALAVPLQFYRARPTGNSLSK